MVLLNLLKFHWLVFSVLSQYTVILVLFLRTKLSYQIKDTPEEESGISVNIHFCNVQVLKFSFPGLGAEFHLLELLSHESKQPFALPHVPSLDGAVVGEMLFENDFVNPPWIHFY